MFLQIEQMIYEIYKKNLSKNKKAMKKIHGL
jgi:hypothetical protein